MAWDTQRNGGVFEKSATGDLLKRAGALPYVEVAYTKTLSNSARGFKWAEAHLPVYANKTYVALQPYGLLAKDLGIVGLNAAKNAWGVSRDYVVAKTPVVTNFVSWIFFLDIVLFCNELSLSLRSEWCIHAVSACTVDKCLSWLCKIMIIPHRRAMRAKNMAHVHNISHFHGHSKAYLSFPIPSHRLNNMHLDYLRSLAKCQFQHGILSAAQQSPSIIADRNFSGRKYSCKYTIFSPIIVIHFPNQKSFCKIWPQFLNFCFANFFFR